MITKCVEEDKDLEDMVGLTFCRNHGNNIDEESPARRRPLKSSQPRSSLVMTAGLFYILDQAEDLSKDPQKQENKLQC